LIDHTRRGRDSYAKLRLDQAGRIWVVQWQNIAVYDGKELADLRPVVCRAQPNFDSAHFCWPLPDGSGVLLSSNGSSLRVSVTGGVWGAERLAAPGRLDSDYTTRSGLWLDSQGRLWFPRDKRSAGVAEKSGARVVDQTGFPRFEDAAGRVWFANPSSPQVVVLDRNGKRTAWKTPPFPDAACLAEDRPGSVWLVTDEGLLNLEVKDTPEGPSIKALQHYTKDVPRGSLLEVWVDRNRRLWFYGPGPNNYRLYRVELPEVKEAPVAPQPP